jgi:SAM-dependent methyltransferase
MIEKDIWERIRCPACHAGRLTQAEHTALCPNCGVRYPISAGRPVLLCPDNALFSIDDYVRTVPPDDAPRSALARLVPSPSVNLSRDSTLYAMRDRLDGMGDCTILVVGSGRQRGWLTPLMQAKRPHALVYTDIDLGADVDIFCDGHDLPFVDGSFDAVITTAVLEHVLYPERVALEIGRVLRTGGVLYSELPFMQQVHEGAYDFTRYSLSGHRRLFRQFAELQSGMAAGPATALVWAIENFALAFFSGRHARLMAKVVVRCLFFWLKYFDYLLVRRPEAMDGASCTFFLGIKSDKPVDDADIIRHYVGAKHLQHV